MAYRALEKALTCAWQIQNSEYTHTLVEYNFVKISLNTPQKTRSTNKVRMSFFGISKYGPLTLNLFHAGDFH